MWLRSADARGWPVTGEYRCIEPRVVDEDGQGHIVLWWGRAFAEGTWGDRSLVNTVVDLEFEELPAARGLVIRFDGPEEGYLRGFTEAWMYGFDGTPWPMDAPVRQVCESRDGRCRARLRPGCSSTPTSSSSERSASHEAGGG